MTIINQKQNMPEKSKEILMRNSFANKKVEDKPNTQVKETNPSTPKQDIVEIKNKEHKDPLLTYPGRGLAYTNEVGVAISPLNKVAGQLLWVPALMYFGADIYDKYKRGENDDYSKSSSRKGLQQAIFQGLASCLLPILAVHGGQHVASHLMKKGKDGLSADSKMEILKSMENKISEGLIKEKTTKEDAKKHILTPIKNFFNVDAKGLKKKAKKSKYSFSNIHFKETPKMTPIKTENYINKQIDEVLELKDQLLKDDKKAPKKLRKMFKELTEEYANDTNGKSKALKETLKKFVNKKTIKPNTIKTLGGFAALFALAMPIDYLVEEVIIKRAVEPGLKSVEENANENPNFLGGMFFKGEKDHSNQQA